MTSKQAPASRRQQIFSEMVLGTLIYSVVLGFFNDYTDILQTKSYSTVFAAAFVMQALTYLTLELKKLVARHIKIKVSKFTKVVLVLSIWLIMFSSKFVFLAVIDFVFGSYVEISGFFGLMTIIVSMVISKTLLENIYKKLND